MFLISRVFGNIDKMPTSLTVVVVVLSIISADHFVESLECYACDHVDNVSQCNNTTHCSNDQSCFTEVTNGAFRLGCVSNKQCGGLSSVATSIVGRSADDNQKDDVTKREVDHCFECCSSNVCNFQLCQQFKPSACIDDAKADCAWMNSKFNICHDVHLAKTICPRFCGLCAIVDGNWGEWSAWSACDVTCASGTQSRSRSCSNPSPVSGGLECPGSARDSKPCSFPPCPVTPTVAFLSHNLASTSLSTNQVLVFTNVTFNAGNGYNKATGKFTAPLPGTYLFSAQFCMAASTSYYIYYGFVLNGNDIKFGFAAADSYHGDCINVDVPAILAVNDTVWIRSKNSGQLYQDSTYFSNTFSGHLIHI